MHVDTSNVKVWFLECPLFRGKNTLQKCFGTKDSIRCSEFGGGHFLEVANVLQVWDFQSVTRALSALGSVSASWSVRSGRFYCMYLLNSAACLQSHNVKHFHSPVLYRTEFAHLIATILPGSNCLPPTPHLLSHTTSRAIAPRGFNVGCKGDKMCEN